MLKLRPSLPSTEREHEHSGEQNISDLLVYCRARTCSCVFAHVRFDQHRTGVILPAARPGSAARPGGFPRSSSCAPTSCFTLAVSMRGIHPSCMRSSFPTVHTRCSLLFPAHCYGSIEHQNHYYYYSVVVVDP